MKTLTILCVFLLCQAAPPKPKPTPLTPPTLADSFIASGTVVLYLEAEIFRGNCKSSEPPILISMQYGFPGK